MFENGCLELLRYQAAKQYKPNMDVLYRSGQGEIVLASDKD